MGKNSNSIKRKARRNRSPFVRRLRRNFKLGINFFKGKGKKLGTKTALVGTAAVLASGGIGYGTKEYNEQNKEEKTKAEASFDEKKDINLNDILKDEDDMIFARPEYASSIINDQLVREDGYDYTLAKAPHKYERDEIVEEKEQEQIQPTQPAQTEPIQAEPLQTEPVQTEPEQTEPVQTEPVYTAPEQTEAVQTAPVQPEQPQTQPEQTEPAPTNSNLSNGENFANEKDDVGTSSVNDFYNPNANGSLENNGIIEEGFIQDDKIKEQIEEDKKEHEEIIEENKEIENKVPTTEIQETPQETEPPTLPSTGEEVEEPTAAPVKPEEMPTIEEPEHEEIEVTIPEEEINNMDNFGDPEPSTQDIQETEAQTQTQIETQAQVIETQETTQDANSSNVPAEESLEGKVAPENNTKQNSLREQLKGMTNLPGEEKTTKQEEKYAQEKTNVTKEQETLDEQIK